MRLQCARCHHHPFERWGPDDYYGFAAFFSRIGRKPGLDPITPRLYLLPEGLAENPDTRPPLSPPAPRRRRRWPTSARATTPGRPWSTGCGGPTTRIFARALVNRYWKHFFGRGLVEPEDDMRVSNPPTNPELLDALADDFVGHGFDLKHLVRTIATSRAYDRSSLPDRVRTRRRPPATSPGSAPRRLPAEVLLDAIGTVTGVPRGVRRPARARSGRRSSPTTGSPPTSSTSSAVPERESVCECERTTEANLAQSLHLLNSAEIQHKLEARGGRDRRLARRPPARRGEGRRALPRRLLAAADGRGARGLPRPSGPPPCPGNAPPGVRGPGLDLDQHQGIPVQSLVECVKRTRFLTIARTSPIRYGLQISARRSPDHARHPRHAVPDLRRPEPAELPPGRRAGDGRPDPARPAPAPGRGGASRVGRPKDTAVIQVFLEGGPSHIDTYDPKPDAPAEFRGEFRPIASNVPGIEVCELLPRQARVMDKMAILRSLHHSSADHSVGTHWIMTGFPGEPSHRDNDRPSVGSIVARLRGANAPGVPPYVALPGAPAFGQGAYLGPGDNPFSPDGDSRATRGSATSSRRRA